MPLSSSGLQLADDDDDVNCTNSNEYGTNYKIFNILHCSAYAAKYEVQNDAYYRLNLKIQRIKDCNQSTDKPHLKL